jgi:hypothetical protein
VYLLFGTDRTIDPSFVMNLIRDTLSPYYAFPFMPVVQIDSPNWRRVRPIFLDHEDYRDEYTYVAVDGPLAKPLPLYNPETGEREGEHPLEFGAGGPIAEATGGAHPPPRFVVGARAVVQLRQPNKSQEVIGEALDALRRKINEVKRSLGLRAKHVYVDYYELDKRSYFSRMFDSLEFPKTPRLPDEGAQYASPALFLMFAGVAIGVVAIAAASRRS